MQPLLNIGEYLSIDGIPLSTPNEVKDGYRFHPDYYQWNAQRPLPGQYTTVSPLVYKRDPSAVDVGEIINANNVDTDAVAMYGEQYPYMSNYRYYGWQGSDRYNTLFSDASVKFMSKMITNMLYGVYPNKKTVVVPDETIRSVADSVYNSSFANADQMQKMVVNYIVNWIQSEADTINKNNNLSIWVQKYDTDTGMKKFDGIKLNQKQRSHYTVWKY